jgi:anaerobic selenocysteine-containing dehydrogenase
MRFTRRDFLKISGAGAAAMSFGACADGFKYQVKTSGKKPNIVMILADDQGHGTIKRSSVHPNCSFFTNWTNEDDSITWDVKVLTSGMYEAQVYYTCKKENVGAELELSFNGKNVKRKVTQAFDTPLVGAAEKKVDKRESLMKDFKALSLGTFRMPKKRGTLTLRATNIPGSRAVDLRYVTLTHINK